MAAPATSAAGARCMWVFHLESFSLPVTFTPFLCSFGAVCFQQEDLDITGATVCTAARSYD